MFSRSIAGGPRLSNPRRGPNANVSLRDTCRRFAFGGPGDGKGPKKGKVRHKCKSERNLRRGHFAVRMRQMDRMTRVVHKRLILKKNSLAFCANLAYTRS